MHHFSQHPYRGQPIPARKPRVEKPAALQALEKYIEAVNCGRFLDASQHRHDLMNLGLVVLLQRPTRSRGQA